MILNESSNKKQIEFETVAINPSIDPSGGYWLRLKVPQPLADKKVFEEVAENLPIKVTPKTIAYILDATLSTTAAKVAQDGVPRKLGDLVKFYPVARGKVKGPYSAFDPGSCSCHVSVCALKGLEKKMDTTRVHFTNARLGIIVTVTSVLSVGGTEEDVLTKGKPFCVYGENLAFDAAAGDAVEVSWTDEDGETQSVALSPKVSDLRHMEFGWPSALAEVEPGTTLTLTFRTRGGIADAEVQENRREVKLAAAE